MAPGERIRAQKRKRSIQEQLNRQVLEQAEHEARLEESQNEEDFSRYEARILSNRRANLEMQDEMDSKRKRTLLTKLEDNVTAALARLNYATDSLNQSIASRIQSVEDNHTRREIKRQKELLQIAKEEKDLKDALDQSKQDYAIYHAQDHAVLENMVAAIQAQEPEDMQDQAQEPEDMQDQDQDKDEEEEEADEDQDNDDE